MTKVIPVILCGGSGTRLWPISRKNMPKQFAQLLGEESLFRAAITRASESWFHEPIIVTSDEQWIFVQQELSECGCTAEILVEPCGKNTAAAIFAAAYHAYKQHGDIQLLVLPSDHYIPDKNAFCKTIGMGIEAAEHGAVVTFGVTPSKPETGYGYIELADPSSKYAFNVKKFHEKPDLHTAQEMVYEGNYVWNAGIFLFKSSTILRLGEVHQADMLSAVKKAVDCAAQTEGIHFINDSFWRPIDSISVDYAILEKTDKIKCVKFPHIWSDLGDWNALVSIHDRDEVGNFVSEGVTQIDCKNSSLISSSNRMHLVAFGVNNILSVVTDDAVLIADASRTQEMRNVVNILEAKGVTQATQHARDHRPWGWFDVLLSMPGYQIKRLHVYPHSKLSLQSHRHRSEHWVVASGTATVILEDDTLELTSNQSIYINAGKKHRLANDSNVSLDVIEVQIGEYLGEGDILRYEDDYSRV